MKVVDRLARREPNWRELDALLRRADIPQFVRARTRSQPLEFVAGRDDTADARRLQQKPPLDAADLLRLSELYRAACADLMLAEAHDLPRETVEFLHALVGRGHNAIYRAQGFKFSHWAGEHFFAVPRRLRQDATLRLAALVFFGTLVIFGLMCAARPAFAEAVAGEAFLEQLDQMYAEAFTANQHRDDSLATGFYIQHNASIGLQCYAWGLPFGLGTLFVMLSNAATLGAAFGHMAVSPHAANFYMFVTAHAPFELTAIVFSGAAGFRLGYGMIRAIGQASLGPLRHEAAGTLPTMGAAVFLFVLAAFLEGFVSASRMPYTIKVLLSLGSLSILSTYVILGGRPGLFDHEGSPRPSPSNPNLEGPS